MLYCQQHILSLPLIGVPLEVCASVEDLEDHSSLISFDRSSF